jgi:hypothetical protein
MEFGRLGLGIINDWLGLAAPSIGDLGNDLAAVDLGEVETTSVAAGAEHACVISSDGKLKCFGGSRISLALHTSSCSSGLLSVPASAGVGAEYLARLTCGDSKLGSGGVEN